MTSLGQRALVLDAGLDVGLAASRALARAGWEVGAAGHSARALAGDSRYTRRYHSIADPTQHLANFRASVQDLVERYGYDIVVSAADPSAAALVGVPLSVPTVPRLDTAYLRLTDKAGLADECAGLGIPYPPTWSPVTPDDDAEAIEGALIPVVVKAARTTVVEGGRLVVSQGATIADDAGAARVALARLRGQGVRPIVQRRMFGPEKYNAAVVRRGGRSELRYAWRILREYPAQGGTGVAGITISPETGVGAEALDLLERLVDRLGYEGIAMAELYRASADGRIYLMEVNARLWGSTWFAEKLGLGVTERGVAVALGLSPLVAPPYRVGRRFHRLGGEWRWLRGGSEDRGSRFDIVHTIGLRDDYDILSNLSDPLPLIRNTLRFWRSVGRNPA